MAALDEILAYLEGTLQLTPAQAAGVAGNLQVESGFSPTAANPNEHAIGIAQWEGGRRQALDAYAAATHGSETSLDTQLGFLGTELHGSESGAFTKLLQTTTPEQAAAVFDQYYERSSGAARGKRVAAATAIAAGKPTTTGPAGDGSAAGSAAGGGGSGDSVAGSLGGGLFNWAPAAFTIGVKILGIGAAAGLVITGAVHTVK